MAPSVRCRPVLNRKSWSSDWRRAADELLTCTERSVQRTREAKGMQDAVTTLKVINHRFKTGRRISKSLIQEYEDLFLAAGESCSACCLILPSHRCDAELWHQLFSFSLLDSDTIPGRPSVGTFGEAAVTSGATLSSVMFKITQSGYTNQQTYQSVHLASVSR